VAEISSYRLRKWRAVVLNRDGDRCQMCAVRPGRRRLNAHHIYPKAIYPSIALEPANGITLCARCHRGCVHAENTFNDHGNWRRFVPMFVAITNPAFSLPE
jgi:hypothetical protein